MIAIKNEIDSHIQNETWTLVSKPKNCKLVSSRWVYKIKKDKEGNIQQRKVRLVARGCRQKLGVDCEETYAPVVNIITVRLLLSIVNKYNFN